MSLAETNQIGQPALVFDADWGAFVAEMERFGPNESSEADTRIDFLLERMRDCNLDLAHTAKIALERKRNIEDWEASTAAKISRKISWLTGEIGQIIPASAGAMLLDNGGKTQTLPNGSYGYKKRPDSVEVVDADAVVEWARAHELPVVQKITESVPKKTLKEYAKTTGETEAPGCWRLVPGADEMFIKPAP